MSLSTPLILQKNNNLMNDIHCANMANSHYYCYSDVVICNYSLRIYTIELPKFICVFQGDMY